MKGATKVSKWAGIAQSV